MQKVYTCIIVDDDEIDRLTTQSFAKHYPFLKISGTYEDPLVALKAAKHTPPDVLFLDIDMDGLTGLELRKQLIDIPGCIFITSYPDYAVESFENAALDFLVKPIKADRFAKTMERLERFLTVHHKAAMLDHTLGGETLFIKDGHEQVKINLHEILYLEALKDYTGVVTKAKKYCVLSPLSTLLAEKSFRSFVRIHRSYAVQKHFIQKMSSKEIVVDEMVLPVGRTYKDELARLKS